MLSLEIHLSNLHIDLSHGPKIFRKSLAKVTRRRLSEKGPSTFPCSNN
jgi:hypothetical protein